MNEGTEAGKPDKRKTGRSPAYPFIPVSRAIEQARALHEKEGDYPAPLGSAVGAWGYSPKSSGGRQTLAALRYYGLIDVTGEGDARKIKVSDIARRIILDQRDDDTEKRTLLRQVALTPAIHRALYERYPSGLASDGTVEHGLIFEDGYNPSAAKELLGQFKDTATYAWLFEPDNVLDKAAQSSGDNGVKEGRPTVKVGDRVQWVSQGVDQFASGGVVLGFSDDGDWLFTDQGSSGVPTSEVTVMESAVQTRTPPPMPAHLANAVRKPEEERAGTRKAVFPLDEGDVALIFPEGITAAGLTELGQYLDIFLKKEAKKAAATPVQAGKP